MTPDDISWGEYDEWEGPWFRGSVWLKLPPKPSEAFKMVYVTSGTEGGLDSANMYDKCIVSMGITQACERWGLTSQLLGHIANFKPDLLAFLDPALRASNATFEKGRRNWGFHFRDRRGVVDNQTKRRQLFSLHSDGTKGSWDSASKAHAKLWAASLANTLAQPEAYEPQIEWVSSKIKAYALPSARKVLFDDDLPSEGWVGALRAGYLSYAVNIPATAAKWLDKAVEAAPGAKWSPDWCIHIFKVLTFGPKVAIWPHRYDAIRPVIEKLYGVDMPDFADELADWQDEMDDGLERSGIDPAFHQLGEIQQVLIDWGYDLGPCGADGRMGPKTKDAIMTFQGLQGLVPDGIVGPRTRAKLLETWRATS